MALQAEPMLTMQPVGATNLVGATGLFSATATGSAPLAYQWQLAEANLSADPRFSGTASNELTIGGVDPADAGAYRLIVTDNTGSVTSQVAMLKVIVPGEILLPDAQLDAAIRVRLKKPTGPLMSNDIAALENLSVCGTGVENLSGLELATNLTSLCLSFNAISNLAPLAGLTQLVQLNLEGNQFKNVESLAGLTNLTSLNLGGNRIGNIAALSMLTQLTDLGLHRSDVANIQPLGNMPGLQTLTLFSSAVSDVSPLAGLTGLNYLELRWCPLTNAETVLAGLTNLSSLYLGGTAVSDLAFLQNHTRLTLLNLDHNNITNLSVLASLPALEELDVSHNPITNIAPLIASTNLTALHLAGNRLSDLTQLCAMTGLKSVSLVDNLITNIAPLGALTNLRSLALSRNPLVEWGGQTVFTNLQCLWLDGVCISNLDLAACMPELKVIGLRDCQRRELPPLAGLTKLTTLYADHNFLTNINSLDAMPQLKSVELTRNLLNLDPGSPTDNVITMLKSNGTSVAAEPQNQPPQIFVVAQWFLATNKTSTLAFQVSDDIDDASQVAVSVTSSDTNLFANPAIVTGIGRGRLLSLTSASNTLGTATVTLTATDLSGSSTNVTLSVAVIPTQTVSIPDPVLDSAVRAALSQSGGSLTDLILSQLTTLSVFSETVSNLNGLQWATNLVELNLKLETITNLDGLALLKGLRSLSIESDSIVDCSAIAALTNLTSLWLKCRNVTNLDFLSGHSRLESLVLSVAAGSSFTPLTGITNLQALDLSNNTIPDYGFLAGMGKLWYLDVSKTRLTNVAMLAAVKNLQALNLSHNRLSDISPLTNLLSLTFVDLTFNVLNVAANPTIPMLIARGASIVSLPQRGFPQLFAPPDALISSGVTSQFRVNSWDEGGSDDEYPVITLSSSDTNLVFGVNMTVAHDLPKFPQDWIVSVTPPAGYAGKATIGVHAAFEVGQAPNRSVALDVVAPLPLNSQLLGDAAFDWESGGGAQWFGQTNTTHDGISAARSGNIGDSQESWIQATFTNAGPRVMSFWWKVSSENGYDFLKCYTNGVKAFTSITGEQGWIKKTITLAEGLQTIRWSYVKDDGYSREADAAWLDEVNLRLPAVIILGNLSQTYDGQPHQPIVTTVPEGLPVSITYNGSSIAPTNAGTFTLSISVNDPIYGGNTTATMTIAKVPLTVAADNKSRPPGIVNPPLTVRYSGFVSGEGTGVLDAAPVVGTTATTNSPPGEYPITLTGGADANYAMTLNPGSLLVTSNQIFILSLTGAGTSNAIVTWTSASNSIYQLQYQSTLGSDWFTVLPEVTATNWTASAVDMTGVGQPSRFYRVKLVTPPSPPVILSLNGAGSGNVTVTWSSTSNLTYRLQCRSTSSGAWTSIIPDVVATNSTASAVDAAANTMQMFYRIMVVP